MLLPVIWHKLFDDSFFMEKCIFLRGYCDKRKHLFWCKQFVFYNRCTHWRGKLKIVWLSGKVLMYIWWLNFVAAWKRKKRVTILTIYIVSLLFYNILPQFFKSYSALLAWKNNSQHESAKCFCKRNISKPNVLFLLPSKTTARLKFKHEFGVLVDNFLLCW